MKALTVYAITTHVRLSDGRWSNGQRDAVMATTSMAKFAKAIGVSAGTVAKYASKGAGGEWAAAALAQPETVLVRGAGEYGTPFRPLR